jgi:hypothetical protein
MPGEMGRSSTPRSGTATELGGGRPRRGCCMCACVRACAQAGATQGAAEQGAGGWEAGWGAFTPTKAFALALKKEQSVAGTPKQ